MNILEANLPNWLVDNLQNECEFCGSTFHIGLSPNGKRVTSHYCPNKECPATVAKKMEFMWTILNVKGIKYGKSLDLVKTKKIKNHLDSFPYVLKDVKPRIHISTFMRLSCEDGIDSGWSGVCKNTRSLDEVLKRRKVEFAEKLRDSMHYFDVVFDEEKKHKTLLSLTIMITGNLRDFQPRELLVQGLNKYFEGKLDLKLTKGVRKTGVHYLVMEQDSPVTKKVTTAKEYGIPILNPQEFLVKVKERIENIERERDDT